ncbi:MAG: EutN/CcmL family microcompartment protein [Promethearchaeota archaeon]
MIIGKVIGNLVATVKTPSHENFKIMAVEPIDLDGKSIGSSILAIDIAQAGIGDAVLICREGNSNRQLTQRPDGAIDAVIVGVIDYIDTFKGRKKFD